jgi:hypothetical protein
MLIIQELISTTRPIFWCGSVTIESRRLLGAAFAVVLNYPIRIAATTHLPFARRTGIMNAPLLYDFKFQENIGTETILDMAYTTKKFEASDPRDRIFALVGLVQDVDDSFIDYSKSLRQVLLEIAKLALQNNLEISLDLLSFATMSSQSETLPSWVPSWTYEGPYLPLAVTHPSKALTGSYEPVLSVGANDVSDPNSIRTGLLIAACFVVDMFNQRRR